MVVRLIHSRHIYEVVVDGSGEDVGAWDEPDLALDGGGLALLRLLMLLLLLLPLLLMMLLMFLMMLVLMLMMLRLQQCNGPD